MVHGLSRTHVLLSSRMTLARVTPILVSEVRFRHTHIHTHAVVWILKATGPHTTGAADPAARKQLAHVMVHEALTGARLCH